MMPVCMQMQIQPAVQIPPPPGLRLNTFSSPWRQRDKVVVVMGATGTGKSRLSVDLATAFWPAEIVNSDKIQVYEGLDVVTNKITADERRGVPHHLLGTVSDPDADYTASHFCHDASRAVEAILLRDRVPIIVGGSNSFIEELVDGPGAGFQARYELCFLWVDVSMPVLHSRVSERVDEMVRTGMVEEVGRLFDPKAKYDRGVRRAIGMPELDRYFRAGPRDERAARLREAVREVKDNTCKLACRQLGKIHRLQSGKGWALHRLDATEAYRARRAGAEAEQAWQRHVAGPGAALVRRFLYGVAADFPTPPPTPGWAVVHGVRARAAVAASL